MFVVFLDLIKSVQYHLHKHIHTHIYWGRRMIRKWKTLLCKSKWDSIFLIENYTKSWEEMCAFGMRLYILLGIIHANTCSTKILNNFLITCLSYIDISVSNKFYQRNILSKKVIEFITENNSQMWMELGYKLTNTCLYFVSTNIS